MIQDAIYTVLNGHDLDLDATKEAFNQIMEGKATNAQIGSFLTAMRMKGETCWKLWAPGAMRPTPLTSPLSPALWSQLAECQSPSTATGVFPANAAPRTAWKPWA